MALRALSKPRRSSSRPSNATFGMPMARHLCPMILHQDVGGGGNIEAGHSVSCGKWRKHQADG